MPTMPRTPYPPPGGICVVSPSDLAGQTDSLLERVERIEAILSLLLGMDITAAQLADITSSAGVLTDLIATASNAAGGWITDGTFTGVAINTLGWPFYNACTGQNEEWPVVTMQDGVLQFGLSSSGQACGAQVETWNAAAGGGEQDYARATYGNVSGFTGWHTSTRGGPTIGTTDETLPLPEINISVTEAGLYQIDSYIYIDVAGTVAGDPVTRGLDFYVYNFTAATNSKVFRTQDAFYTQLASPNFARGVLKAHLSGSFECSANDVIRALGTVLAGTGAATETIYGFSLSVTRISG